MKTTKMMKTTVIAITTALVAAAVLAASVQCSGMTKKGVRCKNKTTNVNGYCNLHQSQAPKQ